jgi:hypothetical protein
MSYDQDFLSVKEQAPFDARMYLDGPANLGSVSKRIKSREI